MNTVVVGFIQAIFVGTTPPTNTQQIWYDTNAGEDIHKYYNTTLSAWINIPASTGDLATVLGNGNTTGGNNIVVDGGGYLDTSDIRNATSVGITAPDIFLNGSVAIPDANITQDDVQDKFIVWEQASGKFFWRDGSTLGGASVSSSWDGLNSEITIGSTVTKLNEFAGNNAERVIVGGVTTIASKFAVRGGSQSNVLDVQHSADGTSLFRVNDFGTFDFQSPLQLIMNYTTSVANQAILVSYDSAVNTAVDGVDRTNFGYASAGNYYFDVKHTYHTEEAFVIGVKNPSSPTTGYQRAAFSVFHGDNTSTYKNATILGGSNTGYHTPTTSDLEDSSLVVNHDYMYMISPEIAPAEADSPELVWISQHSGAQAASTDWLHMKVSQLADASASNSFSVSFASDQTKGFRLENNGNFGIGLATPPTSKLHVGSGEVTLDSYDNARDDSGTFTPTNFLYTNASGKVFSAPISSIGGGSSSFLGLSDTPSVYSSTGHIAVVDALGTGIEFTDPTNLPNFANTDLTFSGTRAHSLGANSLALLGNGSSATVLFSALNTFGISGTLSTSIASDNITLNTTSATFVLDKVTSKISGTAGVIRLTMPGTTGELQLFTRDVTDGAATANMVLTLIDAATGECDWRAAGASGAFSVTDGVTTESVAPGQTLTFADGNGVSSDVSATRTVSFSLDTSGITTKSTPVSADMFLIYDVSGTAQKNVTHNDLKTSMGISDLWTLAGVSEGSNNLGSFSGSLLASTLTIKGAIQKLETELQSISYEVIALQAFANDEDVEVGQCDVIVAIPEIMDGYSITAIQCEVATASPDGATVIDVDYDGSNVGTLTVPTSATHGPDVTVSQATAAEGRITLNVTSTATTKAQGLTVLVTLEK